MIGNGDITSPQKASEMLNLTGCDGIMIGRGVLGKPWLIEEVAAYLKDKTILPSKTMQQRYEIASRHISLIVQYKGEKIGIKEARKHALWYLKGISHSARIKEKISRTTNFEEMLSLLKIPFENSKNWE